MSKSEPDRREVLLVDDEPNAMRALAILLRAHLKGVAVRTFTDPHELFLAAVASRPKVVVTDLHMPIATGIELAGALREALGESCPTLVLLSGDPDLTRRERRLFAEVIRKPVPIASFIVRLKVHLGMVASGVRTKAVAPGTAASGESR
jgi:CheY-like chemotaxis protein